MNTFIRNMFTSIFVISVCVARGQSDDPPRQDPEAFRLIHEAQCSYRQAITSGEGTGWYEASQQDIKSKKDVIVYRKARVRIKFDGIKFRVELDNDRHEHGEDRNIMICDGKTIIAAAWGKEIYPLGCETHIRALRSPSSIPSEAGFSFNPTTLDSFVPRIDTLAAQGFRQWRRNGGLIIVDYQYQDGGWTQIEANENAGYNVTAMRMYRSDDRVNPQRETVFTWDKTGDGKQYVKGVSDRRVSYENGKPSAASIAKLTYDAFVVNAPTVDSDYQIQSLGMPAGTRILDGRSGAKGERYYYNLETTNQLNLEGLLSQVQSLPTEWQPPPPKRFSTWRIVLLALGGVMLVLLGVMIRYWRASKTSSATAEIARPNKNSEPSSG